MNANVNPTSKKSTFVQTVKEEFRVFVNFAYVAKKVFFFMF